MSSFLLASIVGSIVLTIVLNVLPQLFPNAARRAEEKLRDSLNETLENDQRTDLNRVRRANKPRVRVFFPWKMMLIASLVLTVLVNVVGLFAR